MRSGQQRIAQAGGGELVAEAGRTSRVVVGDDVFSGDPQALLEGLDELLGPTKLRGGGGRLVKIADDADADAAAGRGGGGGGGLLNIPAGIDADFTVRAVAWTHDQEMIAAGRALSPSRFAVV